MFWASDELHLDEGYDFSMIHSCTPRMGMDNLSNTTASSAGMAFDPRNLEIKTKSIEKTLVPLVSQITTLVNIKENFLANGRPKSEKVIRAALKVGSAVEAAIERFVAVGETIADENSDIQPEMYDACHEARLAGSAIANLCGSIAEEDIHGMQPYPSSTGFDKSVLLRATRQLLSSVTRVLLLADRVLVKNILRAEDKIAYSLTKLEGTANFTDFVKIFTEFGGEMVDLAHRSGDRQHDLKSDKRRAQMAVARSSLERQTMLLLTSSKTLLRHPDDQAALQCRDAVFYQIRLSLQLISLCVTDGVMISDNNRYATAQPNDEPIDLGMQLTASAAIRQLMEMLEMVRMTSTVGSVVRERLVSALDSLCEMTQDFTDSAYTPHHHREQILDFLEECRFEMSNLIQPEQDQCESLRGEGIEVTVERLNRRLKDLRKQLQIVAMDQISDVFRSNDDQTILSSIKACSISGDIDGVEKYLEKFREHSEHIQEVCRLLHHISLNDTLHIHTGHSERTLRALAPLTLLAGRTFCIHPSSRIARENLEVFCDTWAHNVNEISRLAKESDAAASGRIAAEKQAYMSLPRPGKHGTTQKPSKPITLDVEDQQKMAKVGLEMKLLTSEVDAEAEKWDEYAENDIVKKAKAMSSMAYNMYLFTRGDGPLKTTHDLFTQAEFFAEQANKMYKTVREFSYEVPGSAEKNDLSATLEKIPIHCQQLQVLVKSPTVGKSATFSKVDSVIQETKNLMNEIAKLVTACFVCATKFEIEFRGATNTRGVLPDDYQQRSSRESTLWRRTPSIRRTAPPPLHAISTQEL
uniref:Alpha-catulin n=2 Tax=Steinernema glaseri TaxID=37863 RepID=A0A1I8ARQ4_9BILA